MAGNCVEHNQPKPTGSGGRKRVLKYLFLQEVYKAPVISSRVPVTENTDYGFGKRLIKLILLKVVILVEL